MIFSIKSVDHAAGTLVFRCNICGSHNAVLAAGLGREVPSCTKCGSTVRMRGMIHALSVALFNRSLAIPDFPRNKEIRGKGMSDWDGYAIPLSEKLSYINTYYHKPPRLDITAISPEDIGCVDFLMSTDVFEHVAPPVSRAFENARSMLRKNGAFIFSVPYALIGPTVEHFPNLHEYSIERRAEGSVLVNRTAAGTVEEFRDLIFHGGEGETLEVRVFSKDGLIDDLKRAGFSDVRILSEPCFEHGVYWPHLWSLPLIARVEPPIVEVVDWGPVASSRSKPANQQPDGRSAIWIKTANHVGSEKPVVRVGELIADGIVACDQLVTALIPSQVLRAAGRYPVVLEATGFSPVYVGDLNVYD